MLLLQYFFHVFSLVLSQCIQYLWYFFWFALILCIPELSRIIFIAYCFNVNFLPKSMSNPPPASCHTGSAPLVPEFTADACEPDEESADLLTRSSIIASFVMMGSLGPCLELPPPPPKPAKIKLGFSPVFYFLSVSLKCLYIIHNMSQNKRLKKKNDARFEVHE